MDISKSWPAYLLASEMVLLAGCAAASNKTSSRQVSARIAVLPFDNQSTTIEASDKVRGDVYAELKKRGYALVELEKIDAELGRLGISEGGQLRAVSPEKLRAVIQADLFCFGNVLDFNFKSIVALSQRKVALELRLADPNTEKTVFEGSEEGVTSSAGTDAAGNMAGNFLNRSRTAQKGCCRPIQSSKPPMSPIRSRMWTLRRRPARLSINL